MGKVSTSHQLYAFASPKSGIAEAGISIYLTHHSSVEFFPTYKSNICIQNGGSGLVKGVNTVHHIATYVQKVGPPHYY